MFLTPYTIIIVLIATMALFIWGRWRYDVVAMIALMVSVAAGAVPFNQVYTGLSNPAVITVACVMVISQAITVSGVLNPLIRTIGTFTRKTVLHISSLSFLTAALSAFMNNVGALGLMMPVAIKSAVDNKRSPSLVLMPIALGSALGGLITVIGTPPNLIISNYRMKFTGEPFAMFDFSYVGIGVAVVGLIFISLIGWRLLPAKRKKATGMEDLFHLEDYITEMKVPEKSPIIDKTVREFEKMIKGEFVILGLIRKKRKRLIIPATQLLQKNDILIVEAAPEDIEEILQVGKLELVGDLKISEELRSDEVATMEAVVTATSRLEGRSAESVRIRSRYQMNLLAIARQGKRFSERLHQVKLRDGDVVLLQGAQENIQENVVRLGLLPLVERGLQLGKRPKAYVPLLVFITSIILAAIQLVPVQIAFGGAVLFMVLLNVIPIRKVYESIEWPVIILLAAMIPIGNALQSTGGTGLISHYFISMSGHVSPVFILVILLIATMTLSDFMNNAATAIVMAPIAVSIAQALSVNVDPFLMAVAVGASCSFLTPIGHQNNTLVMGPGGYKFFDYIRMGLPLEIIVLIVSVPLILWAWPL